MKIYALPALPIISLSIEDAVLNQFCDLNKNDSLNSKRKLSDSEILSFIKDSVCIAIRSGHCPSIVLDECLDYRKNYILCLNITINKSTEKSEQAICSDCILCFLKKDLIDSLSIGDLNEILKLCESSALNKKCKDSYFRRIEPSTCTNYSTYDLYQKRLE